jgi:hypothetical protein
MVTASRATRTDTVVPAVETFAQKATEAAAGNVADRHVRPTLPTAAVEGRGVITERVNERAKTRSVE